MKMIYTSQRILNHILCVWTDICIMYMDKCMVVGSMQWETLLVQNKNQFFCFIHIENFETRGDDFWVFRRNYMVVSLRPTNYIFLSYSSFELHQALAISTYTYNRLKPQWNSVCLSFLRICHRWQTIILPKLIYFLENVFLQTACVTIVLRTVSILFVMSGLPVKIRSISRILHQS